MGNFTRVAEKPKILVAPLDWGLGHATRCIPIIYELIKSSCEVIIAAEGPQEQLLRDEFPNLRFTKLQGYRIKYASGRWSSQLRILLQIPKMIMKIRSEKKWLERFIAAEKPNAIISDNRYGLYADRIPSIFVTHQIHIRTGFGKKLDLLLERINHRYIRRFSACWVPDNENNYSLAGGLSNPPHVDGVSTVMLGPITRFKSYNEPTKGYVLILLSGPEPQRSILETKLLYEARFMDGNIIMVRGLPLAKELPASPAHVTMLNHATTDQLNRLICGADYIISRSGYTTIMDLMLLGKKAILIPTPGQAEQEWLADWLFQNHWAFSVLQEKISAATISQVKVFDFRPYEKSRDNALHLTLCNLLNSLRPEQS
jgi:uncharacterized protein (TIGR00661 family)